MAPDRQHALSLGLQRQRRGLHGARRFFAFYLLTDVAAALAHAAIDPHSTVPMVGASGAISVVISAYLVLHPRVKVLALVFNRIPLRLPAYVLLVG